MHEGISQSALVRTLRTEIRILDRTLDVEEVLYHNTFHYLVVPQANAWQCWQSRPQRQGLEMRCRPVNPVCRCHVSLINVRLLNSQATF